MSVYQSLYLDLKNRVEEAMSLMHIGDAETAKVILMRCLRTRDKLERAQMAGQPLVLSELLLH